MNYREVEMSDVIVVLNELDDAQTQVIVASLKALGMEVCAVDDENSVVEGSIETCKLVEIRKIEHVRYIRNVFNYQAELPGDGTSTDDSGPDQYED